MMGARIYSSRRNSSVCQMQSNMSLDMDAAWRLRAHLCSQAGHLHDKGFPTWIKRAHLLRSGYRER
jgi:hypothetical protein